MTAPDQSGESLKHIADYITEAERRGWFDKVNHTNCVKCVELLKAIRNYCSYGDARC